jgi:hypothetical protein
MKDLFVYQICAYRKLSVVAIREKKFLPVKWVVEEKEKDNAMDISFFVYLSTYELE